AHSAQPLQAGERAFERAHLVLETRIRRAAAAAAHGERSGDADGAAGGDGEAAGAEAGGGAVGEVERVVGGARGLDAVVDRTGGLRDQAEADGLGPLEADVLLVADD